MRLQDNGKYKYEMARLNRIMDAADVPPEIQKEMVDGLNEVARDIDRRADWPNEIEEETKLQTKN